jgi:hypothetical protein
MSTLNRSLSPPSTFIFVYHLVGTTDWHYIAYEAGNFREKTKKYSYLHKEKRLRFGVDEDFILPGCDAVSFGKYLPVDTASCYGKLQFSKNLIAIHWQFNMTILHNSMAAIAQLV